MQNEICRRVFFASLALVQDHLHLNATFVGIDQGFGDRSTGEAVSLNEDSRFGGVEFFDHGLGAAALGAEIDFDKRKALWGVRLLSLAGGEGEEKEQDEGEYSHGGWFRGAVALRCGSPSHCRF